MTGSRVVAIMTVLAFLAPAVFAEETIRVSGTGAAVGGMKLLGEAFGKKHPGVKVVVYPSMGNIGGINALAAGKLDLALLARRVKEEEKVPGLVERPYAKSFYVFATSSSNPTDGLGLSEIRDIYAGRKTTWPDGRWIFLVLRPAADAFTGFLESISPAMKEAVASSRKRPGMFIGITDQDAADQIERPDGGPMKPWAATSRIATSRGEKANGQEAKPSPLARCSPGRASNDPSKRSGPPSRTGIRWRKATSSSSGT